MANKPRTPMPIAERAKQFLPFAAVKGLTEALERKEKVVEPKIELNDERVWELNEKLMALKPGDVAKITFYDLDHYVTVTGEVVLVDGVYRNIELDHRVIDFDDLLGIE